MVAYGWIELDIFRCSQMHPRLLVKLGYAEYVQAMGKHDETSSVLRFWQCIWCCFKVFRPLFLEKNPLGICCSSFPVHFLGISSLV